MGRSSGAAGAYNATDALQRAPPPAPRAGSARRGRDDGVGAGGMGGAWNRGRERAGEIREVVQDCLGVRRHWHKRIARTGPNTMLAYRDRDSVRSIGNDDIV